MGLLEQYPPEFAKYLVIWRLLGTHQTQCSLAATVHVPWLDTSRQVGFQVSSHLLTLTHLHPPLHTHTSSHPHVSSHLLTLTHLHPHLLTLTHLHPHLLTLTHLHTPTSHPHIFTPPHPHVHQPEVIVDPSLFMQLSHGCVNPGITGAPLPPQ